MKFLGLDLGTTSVCGVLCDERGAALATATVPNDAALPSAADESFQDPTRVLAAAERTAERLLAETGADADVAIGLTGQMHGILYLDRDGNAASSLATWQDRRAERLDADGTPFAERASRAAGRKIAVGYGLATHYYDVQNGRVPPNAAKIATISDFVAAKLVGASAPTTDPTNAASLGFFDVEKNRFELGAVRAAGLDSEILPEIAEKPRILGFWRGKYPVWTAIGDNQASFLGAVDDPIASVCATVGTSAQFSVFSSDYRVVDALETRPFPGGGFLLVGAALCGGSAWALLRDFFAATLAEFGAPTPTPERLFATMLKLAEEGFRAPDAARLRVATTFDGTRRDREYFARRFFAGRTRRRFLGRNRRRAFRILSRAPRRRTNVATALGRLRKRPARKSAARASARTKIRPAA